MEVSKGMAPNRRLQAGGEGGLRQEGHAGMQRSGGT